MSKLTGYVTVHDVDGVSHTFAPGDDLPGWAEVTNPNVFNPVVEDEAQKAEPKRRGRSAKSE